MQGSATLAGSWFALQGAGAVTLPDSRDPRVHGLLGALALTPAVRGVVGELLASTSVYADGVFPTAHAARLRGGARARWAAVDAWGGAAAGRLDDGVWSYPVATFDLGVGTTWRNLGLTAEATHHVTEAEPRMELPERDTVAVPVRDRIAYTDAVLAPRLQWRALELQARGGVRFVHRTIAFEEPAHRAFGSIDAAWWVTPRIALVAAYGRELADLARGLPDSRAFTLAVRTRLRGAPSARPTRAVERQAVQGAAPDVLVERAVAGGAQLRVLTAAAARHVEVAGTFTEWAPVSLAADGGGAWTLATRIPPGPHRLVVRVDGGAWAPPANLPALEDEELGASVGIITVP